MKALSWHGIGDVRIDNVADPIIEHPRDAIVRITASGICGSDLHLFNGFMPTMEKGHILGHESMGVVVEVGSEIQNLKSGDRVVVPFSIACGSCFFCKKHCTPAAIIQIRMQRCSGAPPDGCEAWSSRDDQF